MKNLSVELAGVTLKNPLMPASGTFGSGMEYTDYLDLSVPGAIVTKGVAVTPWEGNPTPRVAETASGMMNAIGLQNPGVDVFCERDLPFLAQFGTKVIVNICGHSLEEYQAVAERLNDQPADMLEVNISCPNVREGGAAFAQDPRMTEEITAGVKKVSRHPVIIKLSPNVTDIAEIAKAAEGAGADALSLINTLTAMKIDVRRRSFALANRTGGLSGPAIKPVAVRMVYQAAHAVSIPVIGMGGITTGEDVLEFMMAGACATAIGTANFADPAAMGRILSELEELMDELGIEDIREIIGCVE